jgi:recombination protein RecR
MAFHLLDRDRHGGETLVTALENALRAIGHCERCRMLADNALCQICDTPGRDHALICVVESPADVVAVEDSGSYRGRYFVLMGRLSPLDGIGPDELGLDLFEEQIAGAAIREIILATSSTVEGEATAGYLAALAKNHAVAVTRIAHGVPLGGELEYVDSNTLSRAISTRRALDTE